MRKSIPLKTYLDGLSNQEARKAKILITLMAWKLKLGDMDARVKQYIQTKLAPIFEASDLRKIENLTETLTFTPAEAALLFAWNAEKQIPIQSNFITTKIDLFEENIADQLIIATHPPKDPIKVPCRLGLVRGHPLKETDPSFVGQGVVISNLLNNFARDTSFEAEFSYQGVTQTLKTPLDLLDVLLATDHKVLLTQERMYADYFCLSTSAFHIRCPIWIDTGIKFAKTSVKVPATHSQYAWNITGPLVNTKIMFYLGTDGAIFQPDIYDSVDWKFNRVVESYHSDLQEQQIYNSLFLAGLFVQDLLRLSKGISSDGYGYLGVCNDSTTFIESGLRDSVTLYPLLRNKKSESPSKDGLVNSITNSLPSDTRDLDIKEAVPRILKTQPPIDLWPNLGHFLGETLVKDLVSLKEYQDKNLFS
jgi:hypothetical protein